MEQSTNNNCVGGMEMSISFSSAEDRTAILHSGTKLGWSPALKGITINSQTGDAVTTWETDSQLEIQVDGALLSVDTVVIPTRIKEKYKMCYIRYKFYDRGNFFYLYSTWQVLSMLIMLCHQCQTVVHLWVLTQLQGIITITLIFVKRAYIERAFSSLKISLRSAQPLLLEKYLCPHCLSKGHDLCDTFPLH